MRINKETEKITAEYSKIKITYTLSNNTVIASMGDIVFACKRYGDIKRAENKFHELAEFLESHEGCDLHYVKECLKCMVK